MTKSSNIILLTLFISLIRIFFLIRVNLITFLHTGHELFVFNQVKIAQLNS